MAIIKFLRDYGCCWKEGDTFDERTRPQFADVVVRIGYAKRVDRPPMNKMVEHADKEKEIGT